MSRPLCSPPRALWLSCHDVWGKIVSLTVGPYLTVLIFEVDGHRYGLDISQIIEVIRAVQPTRLAQAPDIVEGLINVRGRPAVVLDMRARFELPRRAIQPSDVLLLCELKSRLYALRADLTHDLQTIDASKLADADGVSETVSRARGVVNTEQGVLLICDLGAFIDESEELSLSRALARADARSAEVDG